MSEESEVTASSGEPAAATEAGPEDIGEDSVDRQPRETGASENPVFERRWSKRTETKAAVSPVQDTATDLEKERTRGNELFDRLQRTMADLSNYRKRAESEREEMAKFAAMLLVAELLPVLDNFDRALAAIPEEIQYFSWIQGIALIERHLRAILERQGVESIEAVGKPFNPSLHEAIVEEASNEAPGTVIGDLQTGYTMHGKVIRPTLAKVAKAAENTSTPAPEPREAEQGLAESAPEPMGSRADDDTTNDPPVSND